MTAKRLAIAPGERAQSGKQPPLRQFGLAAAVPAALAVILSVANAHAGDAAAGRATFVSICSTCHGLDGIATLEYAPSFAKCQRLDQDDATLLVSVRDGMGGRMPPWGVMLTEHEILDAIAYARTFCKRGQSGQPGGSRASLEFGQSPRPRFARAFSRAAWWAKARSVIVERA